MKQAIKELAAIENTTFSEVVQAMRLLLKQTRHQFAKNTNLPPRAIRQIEKNTRLATIVEVLAIINTCNLPLEPFLAIYFQEILRSEGVDKVVKVRCKPKNSEKT